MIGIGLIDFMERGLKMSSLLVIIPNYTINDVEISGLALRYLEICNSLSKKIKCTIVAKVLPYNFSDKRYKVNVVDLNSCFIEKIIDVYDYIMFSDLANIELIKYSKKNGKKVICENQVPIEHMYYDEIRNSSNREDLYHNIICDFKEQIKYSDYFIARSTVEYCQLLSTLFLLEKIKIDDYFKKNIPIIYYIPIGYSLDSVQPHKIKINRNKFVLSWNGGVWDFLNVSWLNNISLPENVEIQFMYGTNKKLRKNAEKIKFLKIDYYLRDEYMKGIDAFICIGKMLPENLTCHRLRLRDVLLYKKPIIVDGFGATAEFVDKYKIGYVVYNENDILDAINKLKDVNNYKTIVNNIVKCSELFIYENNIIEFERLLNG